MPRWIRGLGLVALMSVGLGLAVVAGCWSGAKGSAGGANAEASVDGHTVNPPGEYSRKPPKDPIEANGRIFEGWSAPQVALIVTGEQDGYIEPCGCAGLDNQKGGLGRRHALLEELRGRGWPVVALDLGGLVNRFGVQSELKYKRAISGLAEMGYRAVGFGPSDLELSSGALLNSIAELPGKSLKYLAANVSIADYESAECVPYLIVEEGGLRIGVTAVLAEEDAAKLNTDDVKVRPAEEALSAVMPNLANCDVRVLLSYAPVVTSRKWAQKHADFFDVVVTAGGAEEPPAQPEAIGSRTWLVEVGHKGMYAGVIGWMPEGKGPRRFQRVPLDSRFHETPAMQQLLRDYQSELEGIGFEGLELKTAAHPRGNFVGPKQCAECHPTAFGIWSGTKHAQATESLTKIEPPRQFDPECLSCHVTGWEPQEYFPFESGYLSQTSTPHLTGNSCENCHGPGAEHVAAERGNDLASRATQRVAVRLTEATAVSNCQRCHDLDNSPEFNFDLFWPKVKHKGKK